MWSPSYCGCVQRMRSHCTPFLGCSVWVPYSAIGALNAVCVSKQMPSHCSPFLGCVWSPYSRDHVLLRVCPISCRPPPFLDCACVEPAFSTVVHCATSKRQQRNTKLQRLKYPRHLARLSGASPSNLLEPVFLNTTESINKCNGP